MRLRTRLALVFFLISVVPLAVVTAYGYYASARALRRAAEAQSQQLAKDMGQRMAWVTADLADRMAQLWRIQSGPSGEPRQPGEAALRREVAGVLGEVAPIVEQLEFLPPPQPATPSRPETLARAGNGAAPVPSAAPVPPAAPMPDPPAAAGPPAQVPRPPRIVVDMTPLAGSRAPGPKVQAPSPEAIAAWTRAIQGQAQKELLAGADGMSGQAPLDAPAPAARAIEERRRERERRIVAMTRNESIGFPMRRDGEVIGWVNARINRHRVLETVLGLVHHSAGEIPFIGDTDGEVHALRPDDQRTLASLSLTAAAVTAPDAPPVRTVRDWLIVTRHDPSGVVFGIARPIGDSLRDLQRVSLRNLGLGLVLIALASIAIVPLSSRMTRNLSLLTDGAHRISRGERGTRVEVATRDEIGQLARAFNQMAGDLESHEKVLVERERLRRELELCRQIQHDMLPQAPLRLGLAEVKGVSIPAREVGGDFFNYFVLPTGAIALLVGDVSGKGVGAALLMANIQATLRARMPLESDLARLAGAIDREVAETTPDEIYLTLFLGVLDPTTAMLRYVNAGHNPQFLLRRDGTRVSMDATGLPVGLMPGRGYEERRTSLSPGDLLFLYTDGMVEVENEAGDMFGVDRLDQVLDEHHALDVDTLLVRVEDAVRGFRGQVEPSDDATMMALRFNDRAVGR